MSIDVRFTNNDNGHPRYMDDGVTLIHKVGMESVIINMDWDDVNNTISLLMAHRELKSSKERIREFDEEKNMSYGGTK